MSAQNSPKKDLVLSEKDKQYHVTLAEFGSELKGLVKFFHALTALNTALSKAGPGSSLYYPNPENSSVPIVFNRKQLRSGNALFIKKIKELKNYLRVARKKPRAPAKPESFSGVFTPVYAGDALRYFFNEGAGQFGVVDPLEVTRAQQEGRAPTQGAEQALMASLQAARDGYLLRNTITMLFYVYAHTNGLQLENAQYARSDDVMNRAFGGDIAASFYKYKVGDKSVKMTMNQALESGLITQAYNTYQVIAGEYPPGTISAKSQKEISFDPQHMSTYFYQNIAALNYFSSSSLKDEISRLQGVMLQLDEAGQDIYRGLIDTYSRALATLEDPNVRQRMLEEHNLTKETGGAWRALLDPQRKAARDQKKKQNDALKKARRS